MHGVRGWVDGYVFCFVLFCFVFCFFPFMIRDTYILFWRRGLCACNHVRRHREGGTARAKLIVDHPKAKT